MMTSRERLESAWAFEEADRVPVEFEVCGYARDLPEAQPLLALAEEHADNFVYVPGFDWGFFGLDAVYEEEIVDEVAGDYRRKRRTYRTAVGEFQAVTRHSFAELDPNDYHWEQRYIESLEDLERLAAAPRPARTFDVSAYNAGCADIAQSGLPATGIQHPLGMLVRLSNMQETYGWLLTEPALIRRFLESTCSQWVESIGALRNRPLASPPVFLTWALEMLVPPWLGPRQFDELVFPYDKTINDAIHSAGGRHRAHCHGNSGAFLERFADMGVDSVEPLEPPPFGDNDLAHAKKTVGNRMLLSGNVPSQAFFRMSDDDVRAAVREAIRIGAPGGGFTLRLSGGACGEGKTREQMIESLRKGQIYLETALDACRAQRTRSQVR